MNSFWHGIERHWRALATACLLGGFPIALANAELVLRFEPKEDETHIGGAAIAATNSHVLIVHEQRTGMDYDPETSRFTVEARPTNEPDTVAWSRDFATLPGVRLEPHIPLWHLAGDAGFLYLLTNSTMKGRSHLLFRITNDGDIAASRSLNGYIFQRGIHPTPYGLVAAFHSRVVMLGKVGFEIQATWSHPRPSNWKRIGPTIGQVVAIAVDDRDVFVLEFTELPRTEDFSFDSRRGATRIFRLSLTPPSFGDAALFATVDASAVRRPMASGSATGENLVVTDDLVVAAVINESGRWNLCEIPKVAEPAPACAELEQAAHVDARETALALTGMPNGGYLWGIPTEGGVALGMHAAETTMHQLNIQEGTATAVRLAANEAWIFALVDVTSGVGGARHFMELHRIALPAAAR